MQVPNGTGPGVRRSKRHEYDKHIEVHEYVKYKRTGALSLWHLQYITTVDIHRPLQTKGETRCPGGVGVSCLASHTRHECPRHAKFEKGHHDIERSLQSVSFQTRQFCSFSLQIGYYRAYALYNVDD